MHTKKSENKTVIKSEYSNEVYEIRELIGEGAYGKVYKAFSQNTQKLVALKTVNLEETEGFPISSLRELMMLRSLDHPNIVKLHDVVIEGKDWISNKNAKMMLAIDYYPHDFCGIINDHNIQLGHAQVKSYMQQLLSAVAYIHSKGVMHRDMKTSNILVSYEGEVKLADFGLSCFKSLDDNEEYESLVVTRWYRSPELLLGERRYDYSIDMWSVGCILAEFMLGHPLFVGSDTKDQLRLIFELCGTPDQNDWSQATQLRGWKEMKPLNSIPNKLVQRFSRFAKNPVLDLLSKLLCLNPKKRITAAEALNHPWFKTAPLPNKDEKSLPGTARNEFWAKKKRELKHQLPNPQIGKRLHSVMSADQENTNSRSILKSSQASSTIGARNEPVRKQQRFNATDSDQNHYRSMNPPIQPTIARYRSQNNNG